MVCLDDAPAGFAGRGPDSGLFQRALQGKGGEKVNSRIASTPLARAGVSRSETAVTIRAGVVLPRLKGGLQEVWCSQGGGLAGQLKGWRHLFAAVLTLATGSGPVEERLRRAYWDHLRLLDPAQSLPDHLRAECDEIVGELARLFPQREARVPEKWVQASDLAERIVSLYIAFLRR